MLSSVDKYLQAQNNTLTSLGGDFFSAGDKRVCSITLRKNIKDYFTNTLKNKLSVSNHRQERINISIERVLDFVVSDFLLPLIDGKVLPDLKIDLEIFNLPDMPQERKFLFRALQVVNNYIGDSSFGVEKMAKELHLSRAQLFRKLKAVTGLSPNEFINEIRLQKAAEKIRLRTNSVTQISYSVGFNEQSYFAKKFRKRFGVNPRDYSSFDV